MKKDRKERRLSPELSNRVIDALGGNTVVGNIFRIGPQAISHWRRMGIPEFRLDYLRLAYKKLDVMQEPEIKKF